MSEYTIDEIKGLLDDIDNARYVSDWEAEFIDKMMKMTDAGQMPSGGQIIKIMNIYAERVK